MTSSNSDNTITCPTCGKKNLVGTLMCTNCGTMLSPEVRHGTRSLTQNLPELQEGSGAIFSAGSETFEADMQLRVVISSDERNEQLFDPKRHKMLLVGRRDPMTRTRPHIDLEDYDGYRMGVSRKHCVFMFQDSKIALQDYGSANGTYLNGVRLPAHNAHTVCDGDEVRLGNLSLRVFFVRKTESTS